jgi:hypothetical protein
LYLIHVENSTRVIFYIFSQIQRTYSCLRYTNSGSGQIQYNYSSTYAGFNIHLNVSPQLLVVYRLIDPRYAPHLLPNTGQNIRFRLYQLWPRSNRIYIQFSIFRQQYSIERIYDDVGDMSTIQCALYSTFAAKHRAHQPICASSTLGIG